MRWLGIAILGGAAVWLAVVAWAALDVLRAVHGVVP